MKEYTNVRVDLLGAITNGVLPLPEGTTRFRGQVRRDFRIGEEETTLLVVARLSQEKGIDVLLQAFRILLEMSPEFKLIIVGAGVEEKNLKLLAKKLKIEEAVRFAGFQTEVIPYYSSADIYVAPSRFEGLGMSVLEAMRSGLPIVATNVGGHPEIVQDGVSGFLVPSEDAKGMASAILEINKMQDLGKQMGDIGKDICHKKYDINRVVAEYEKLYREVTGTLKRGECLD